MAVVKVTSIGNSLGVILSRDLLAMLRVDKGDRPYVTETPDGIMLRPYRPDFAEQMDRAEAIIRDNRDALRKLSRHP